MRQKRFHNRTPEATEGAFRHPPIPLSDVNLSETQQEERESFVPSSLVPGQGRMRGETSSGVPDNTAFELRQSSRLDNETFGPGLRGVFAPKTLRDALRGTLTVRSCRAASSPRPCGPCRASWREPPGCTVTRTEIFLRMEPHLQPTPLHQLPDGQHGML